jgi:hypothetical protein
VAPLDLSVATVGPCSGHLWQMTGRSLLLVPERAEMPADGGKMSTGRESDPETPRTIEVSEFGAGLGAVR